MVLYFTGTGNSRYLARRLSLIHICNHRLPLYFPPSEVCFASSEVILLKELSYKHPVSYTHLDVYKRQLLLCPNCLVFVPTHVSIKTSSNFRSPSHVLLLLFQCFKVIPGLSLIHI